jgi:hypothetical protein
MGAARGGALLIEHPSFAGSIYFEGGHPVHAEAGPLRGLKALELLAGLKSAPFRFDAEQATPERSIERSLETHQLILHQFEAWSEVHLPHNWELTLHGCLIQGPTQLSPLEADVLAQAQGKSLAQALMSGRLSPLETAQVLTLYGGGQGVAAIDEGLFTHWQGLVGGAFMVRLRTKTLEATLRPEPRLNMQGRVGLFERDMRQLRLSRGVPVEVWPEAR